MEYDHHAVHACSIHAGSLSGSIAITSQNSPRTFIHLHRIVLGKNAGSLFNRKLQCGDPWSGFLPAASCQRYKHSVSSA